MSNWYDVAQICLNGHVITDAVKEFPQHSKKFCDTCGARTITNCPHCNTEIQGYYNVEGVLSVSEYEPPKFCPNCGNSYPWTETKIQAAQELAEELENISKEKKKIITRDIGEIVKDTPRTQLAAMRFKKILSRVSNPTIVEAFKKILVDIVSETAKKIIWPS